MEPTTAAGDHHRASSDHKHFSSKEKAELIFTPRNTRYVGSPSPYPQRSRSSASRMGPNDCAVVMLRSTTSCGTLACHPTLWAHILEPCLWTWPQRPSHHSKTDPCNLMLSFLWRLGPLLGWADELFDLTARVRAGRRGTCGVAPGVGKSEEGPRGFSSTRDWWTCKALSSNCCRRWQASRPVRC